MWPIRVGWNHHIHYRDTDAGEQGSGKQTTHTKGSHPTAHGQH